jgi:hypothetical protein
VKIRLTYSALDDLDLLLMNEAERSGWTRSMDVEAQLWHHFEELSRTPALGHFVRTSRKQRCTFTIPTRT